MEIVAQHVVAPHKMPARDDIKSAIKEPDDFKEFDRRIKSWNSEKKASFAKTDDKVLQEVE